MLKTIVTCDYPDCGERQEVAPVLRTPRSTWIRRCITDGRIGDPGGIGTELYYCPKHAREANPPVDPILLTPQAPL